MNYAKVELHLHLDGSLNLMWVFNKAKHRNVIDQNMSFEDFYNVMFSRNVGHSAETIKKFDLVCDVLQLKEDIVEATYNLVKHLDDLGLIYAEIRFASQQHCKGGLSQLEALQAVIEGANKAMNECNIKVGIINCLMHKGDSANFNLKENLETIEVTKKMLGKGAVGLDLAGFENNCDLNEYSSLFEKAREYNIPYTIHAAEMGNGENILKALAMKPNRIGHGINCIQDEKYLKAVVDSQIPLEICVTSNIKSDMNYGRHPIRKLIDAGAKITINSDNMIFARTDISNEHFQLKMLGVSDEQLKQFTINAIDAAFIDEETKSELLKRVD